MLSLIYIFPTSSIVLRNVIEIIITELLCLLGPLTISTHEAVRAGSVGQVVPGCSVMLQQALTRREAEVR